MVRRSAAVLPLVALLTVAAACAPAASSSPSPSESPTAPASPSSPAASTAPPASSAPPASESPEPTSALGPFSCTFPVTAAASSTPGPTGAPAQAVPSDVRVGQHPDYDRIVFEYSGTTLPGLSIEQVSPPFTLDPSGLPLTVNGSSFLRIRLDPVAQVYAGSTSFAVGYPYLKDLERQGDYEGVQTWIAGFGAPVCVRVFTLSSPTRLVIDVQHA